MQNADPGYALNFINGLLGIIEVLVPIVVTIGLIVFFMGIVKFLASAGDVRARDQAKGFLALGVITLFVMVSVWGLVSILVSIFDIDQDAETEVPMVEGIDPF